MINIEECPSLFNEQSKMLSNGATIYQLYQITSISTKESLV